MLTFGVRSLPPVSHYNQQVSCLTSGCRGNAQPWEECLKFLHTVDSAGGFTDGTVHPGLPSSCRRTVETACVKHFYGMIRKETQNV